MKNYLPLWIPLKKLLAFAFVLTFLVIPIRSFAQFLMLNEYMGSNTNTLPDEDGDFEDWIEIYNSANFPIRLGGVSLSDDTSNIFKWSFPDTTLMPGKFMVIMASGKDTLNSKYFHTNFKVNSAGEYILLVGKNGKLLDKFDPVAMGPGISFGRSPDGSAMRDFLSNPTPGGKNAAISPRDLFTFKPIASQPSGFYAGNFNLVMETKMSGTEIRYTLDGSDPTMSSLLLKDSIVIGKPKLKKDMLSYIPTNSPSDLLSDPLLAPLAWQKPAGECFQATVVKSAVFKDSVQQSDIAVNTYFVDAEIFQKFNLPIFSIVTPKENFFSPETGIYVPGKSYERKQLAVAGNSRFAPLMYPANYNQRGREWEKNINVEFFEASGKQMLSQKMGVRTHGNLSRASYVKNLRLYARADLDGNSFMGYNFFKYKSPEHIKWGILSPVKERTLLRDLLVGNIAGRIGMDYPIGKTSVLFINGEYWGIHVLREVYDKYYFANRYDVETAKVTLIGENDRAFEGEPEEQLAFKKFMRFAEGNNLALGPEYDFIKKNMDVHDYIKFAAVSIYGGNPGWSEMETQRVWRVNRGGQNLNSVSPVDGRWRWLLFDMDMTFGTGDATSKPMPSDNSMETFVQKSTLLKNLLSNASFRKDFINTFADMLNTTLSPAYISKQVDSISPGLAQAMLEDAKRYPNAFKDFKNSYPYSNQSTSASEIWNNHANGLKEFVSIRQRSVFQQIAKQLGLEGTASVTIEIPETDHGFVSINSVELIPGNPGVQVSSKSYPWTGIYFKGVPVTLKAVPGKGFKFMGWKGIVSDEHANPVVITPGADMNITPMFSREQ